MGLLAKALVFDTAVAASTDFLSSDFTPSEGRSALRITVSLDTACKLEIHYDDGSSTIVGTFNNDTDLAAGNIYTFTVGCDSSLTVNFQHDDAGSVNCDLFICDEVTGGVL
jgi:hypothetical protein